MISAFMIAAISLDGYISPIEHTKSTQWTSDADKKLFVQKTKEAGVMVMGRTTFDTIGKALPGRRTIVYTSKSIDIEGVETTQLPPAELLAQLESEGHTQVAICGGASIWSQFMHAGCISKLYITLEPILFGSGVPLLNEIGPIRLTLVSSTLIAENTLLLEYDITK